MGHLTAFWMLAALLPVFSSALQPTYFISAPNVIRVGVEETVVVNIFGSFLDGNVGDGVPVTVEIQDYPARTKLYATDTVNVKKNEASTVTLKIQPDDVVPNNNPQEPQYVYLHASSQSAAIQFDEGTPVLLSYKAGYTFIQTDKPIYTPNQEVFIRLIAVDQQMRPSQDKVQIDIITPQGVIVKRFDNIQPESGFVSEKYKFPAAPAFGNWSVVAYYGHEMKHNTTVQFLVKEYVLPTYSVKITLDRTSYILSSYEEITTLVQGNYVFGEKVQGYYRIKYSLLDTDGSMEMVKDGINGTLDQHGQGVHTLSLSDVKGNKEFDEFLGKRLHIEAFVVEGATGKVESANNSVLEFVDSPFRFSWDQTLKYFKTNLPFEVKTDVVYCYGDPVPNLQVRVSAMAHVANGQPRELLSEAPLKTTNANGQVPFTLNVQPGTTRIVVTMTTQAGGELAKFEQTDTYEILQFDASGNNELLIRPTAEDRVSVGDSISVDLQRSGANQEKVDAIFTYIVAGGKIVQAQAIEEVIANTVTDIQITQDMVPSARMVAYYVNDNNQVVADSVWIDVDDQCENPVEISVPANTNGRTYYMPRDTVTLTLSAKEQTKIALLAVDSAVYLLQDYHRLNKKKVFARMASYDLGCGPGGGSDTQDIFKNAGISILTNAQLQTQRRGDLSCDEHNRRRRRAVNGVQYNIQDLEEQYEGNDTLTDYCTRGKRIIVGWSCLRRAVGLSNRTGLPMENPIVQALYRCCLAVNKVSGRLGNNGGRLPPPKIDFTDVQIRNDFPESFLFKHELVNLGESKSTQYPIALPDSITTWIIHAVGISPLHGMCVADNKELVVRREYFLDVSLPYSVMPKEQVAILATVYNYDENGQEIRVILQMAGIDGLCSNARAGDFVSEEGTVEAKKAKSFTFIVIPLEVKDFTITIYMFSSFGNDAVSKTLHVVPEGTPTVQPLSIVVDPAGFGAQGPGNEAVDHGPVNILKHMQFNDEANRIQHDTVRLTMPEDVVPNTAECEVNVIGSLLGPVASAIIDGLNSGAFLQIPRGCGEQTMIYMAPNVYIFKYLKSIDEDTPKIEEMAIKNIEDGYSRQVNNFLGNDGAFRVRINYPANSWLTAFVLRVFCQAKEFAFIDDNVICKSMEYLKSTQSNVDGSFGFTYKTYHGSHFMGGVLDKPIQMTAFVIMTLSECDCATVDSTASVSRATLFLEGKLQEIQKDAHALAMVTYALALVNSGRANEFNTQLRTLAHDNQVQGTKHFGPAEGGPLTVETTAYALLAQIELGEIPYSYPIVQWLMGQRDQIGHWYSTQDTMIALQALSMYAQQAHSGDISLDCDVTSSVDANFRESWSIGPANALVLQAAQAPVEGDIVVETQGVGIATLSVNLHYYKASGDNDQCPFEVTITPSDLKPEAALPGAPVNDDPKKKQSIQVCAKYTEGSETHMAIIDVGLFSGFTPVTKTLKKAVDTTELIQAYEVSDRSVIFYADKIPGGEGVDPLCVTFEAQQDIKVGNVQPVPVKVYDYYLPDKKCIKFYRPDGKSPVLETICHGGACECAAASCLNMDPDMYSNPVVLKNKACETVHHFAYKTSFVARHEKDTFEMFTMAVTPLKTGTDQDVQVGQHRQFWKSFNCDQPRFEEGNDYLIVGKGGLPIRDANNVITEYRHFVDSEFTVIQWPREDQYRDEEKRCKKSCPVDSNNRKCKNQCRIDHRPAENSLRQYFNKVELGLMDGCDQ